MRTLALIVALVTLSLLIYSFAEKENKKKIEYLGQVVPPDMEFIPGNQDIPSFFISKSQETNLNWTVYLDWLQRVYTDYPQVVQMATPHNLDDSELSKFNDPILKAQFRNPAFAYYPVTGVDWEQIQNYLCWKTDRLNESIMIRLKYLKLNPDQINKDNYNYEAYMAGQYEGMVWKLVPGKEYSYRSVKYVDQTFGVVFPFLFPGYRLPTEEEWEYAAKDEFQNKTLAHDETYPYGSKFFLFDYLYKDVYGKKNLLLTNYADRAGTYEPADLNRIKGGTTYDNRIHGIYNIGNNVKEWVMDEYSSTVRHYPDAGSVYSMNGFLPAVDSLYHDQEGNMLEKDSLGRMYYRTMGVANNGNDFRVMQYRYKVIKTYTKTVPNPDSLKVKLAQKDAIRSARKGYFRYESYRYEAPLSFEIRQEGYNWINLEYYSVATKFINGVKTQQLYLDINKVLNSPAYVKQRMFITNTYYEYVPGYEPKIRHRVVKGGTWRNPSTAARESLMETEASPDVGFRTVLPYLGMPVYKKNKVKWE